jgi:twitching motility protein PilT
VVFATLHTISASQSINRIIGMFSNEEEEQIRQRLADTLRCIISQRLVPKATGGRILATEIMGSNLRTRETVLLGESDIRSFHEIIEANVQNGWHSFEQSLIAHFKESRITEETAILFSVNKPAMRKSLDVVKKEMFPGDDTPTGLRLNLEALHVAPGTTPKPVA